MTKTTMIKNYRKFSANDAYLIGLEKGKNFYVIEVKELMPRWINVDHTTHSKGYKTKIDIDITASERDKLIAKHCLFSTTIEELNAQGQDNKGHNFESLIWGYFGLEGYQPDSIGFWHDGDVTANGIKYQIKLNHAQIVLEQTLETLKAFNRLGLTPPKTFTRNTKTILENARKNKKK